MGATEHKWVRIDPRGLEWSGTVAAQLTGALDLWSSLAAEPLTNTPPLDLQSSVPSQNLPLARTIPTRYRRCAFTTIIRGVAIKGGA